MVDIEKGEGKPNAYTRDYHGILQALSIYIHLLTIVVGSRSAHTREVAASREKLRTRMDLYVNIDPKMIIYLLWEIFLDARGFFSGKVQLGEPLLESQLIYKKIYL